MTAGALATGKHIVPTIYFDDDEGRVLLLRTIGDDAAGVHLHPLPLLKQLANSIINRFVQYYSSIPLSTLVSILLSFKFGRHVF